MRRLTCTLTAGLLVLSLLSGCGRPGSAKNDYEGDRSEDMAYAAAADDYAYDDYAMEEAAEEPMYAEKAGGLGMSETVLTDDPGSNEEVEAAAEKRKLIKTVNLSVETEEFDEFVAHILQRIESLGGYPENSSINGSSYGSSTKRYAYITARIPAENLNAFVGEVTDNSNVLSRDESIDDVTLNYVDMEAKKKSLQTEYDRLNKLIETAEDLETLILLEERLAEVRYELESYESRLRTMDNQVSYSTVNINVEEVVKYTPTPTHEESLGERMMRGFKESCESMVETLQDLLVIFVSMLPFLLLLLVFALIIFLIIRFCVKKSKAKAAAHPRVKPVRKPGAGQPAQRQNPAAAAPASANKTEGDAGKQTEEKKQEALTK